MMAGDTMEFVIGKPDKDVERPNGMRCYSTKMYYALDPRPEDVRLEDIAHGLSNQCRFAGHTIRHYSVAQHSVLVSILLERTGEDPIVVKWGLLHDAPEAYLVDLPRPIKYSGKLEAYKEFEMLNQIAIMTKFGLPTQEPSNVKKADVRMLHTEQRDLFRMERDCEWLDENRPLRWKIRPWSPEKAERMFVIRFKMLEGTANWFERFYFKRVIGRL